MEPILLERMAIAQHKTLSKMADALERHANRSSRVRNDKLESLGVVKYASLDIDDPSPCDFERRFFKPSYQDEHMTHSLGADDPEFVFGLLDTCKKWSWGETCALGRPSDDGDDGKWWESPFGLSGPGRPRSPWIPPTPDQYPVFRFRWFMHCVESMQQMHLDCMEWWEDESERQQHESRTDGWRNPLVEESDLGDSTYWMPGREEMDWDYRPLWLLEPRDPSRPHFAIVMGDSKVPRNAEDMLVSELHAAAEMSKRQLSCGSFTNHHTKPIIVFTFMSETHARITQAHFDAKTDKLMVRQSRMLDLSGKQPTADAYLLLRWMMNLPIGETEYKQDSGGHRIDGDHRDVPSQPGLVTTEAT